MSDMSAPPPVSTLRGIGFKVASVAVFMAMAVLIKSNADKIPPGEAVFFRSAFAMPVIVIWLLATGKLKRGLSAKSPFGHIWRAVVGSVAMICGFAGLGLLPLPEVTAIGYAAPLLTVVFAAMFLGEEIRFYRIFAVVLGLGGVVMILSPRLTALSEDQIATTEALGAVVVLTGAVFAALAQVFVRKLVREESTSAIVFYFSLNATLLSLLTLPWGWTMPDASTFAVLVMTGVLGGVGQVLLTSSYRFAPASVVAPFEYTSMVMALTVGFLIFDEVPTMVVIGGATLVMGAGILVIWREHRLGLERARQRASMSPQG